MAQETPESTESTPGEAASTPATSDNVDTSSTETTLAEEAQQSAAREGDAEPAEDDHGDDGESEADDSEQDAEDGEADESSEETSADGSTGAPGEKKKRKRKRKKKAANPEAAQRATDRAPFHVGEEVFGKVTAVVDAAIMVDLSGKALAIFDRSEMEPDDLLPEVGERFVGRVLNDGGRGGLVVLTRKPLREEEEKPKIEQAHRDGSLVSGLVTGVIKGGVEVLIGGVRAFAPASGVDLHPRAANLAQLVGQRLDFKVTSYEKQGRDVVVTRRPMIEKEAHERRKAAREALVEGAEMAGIVRTVVDWGVFVALPEAEYLEGLVHASEVSHNPREKIADIVKPGQKIRVKVLKVDEKGKVWLSRKALLEDPFAKVFENVQIGQIIKGEVTRVEEFGAFVKIADGVEGLIHVSDLGVVRVDDARNVLKAGDSS
jgi:small subunit ribosomal protein S1